MLYLLGEKPFTCGICGRAFSQSGSRNVHIKKHHPDSSQVHTPVDSSLHGNLLVLSSEDGTEYHGKIYSFMHY